jgi:polyisoprenoid-binding protein YceI
MSDVATQVPPGYLAGTWDIDPVHSEVSFSVRHMMVSKVRGRFGSFQGQITTGADHLASSVNATIDLASVDTNDETRDNHLRSPDFLDVENHKTMSFTSTSVQPRGDGYVVEGELSLHGVTRPITLDLEPNGFGPDPFGGTRSGFSAKAEISRKDFGITFDMPLEGGGVVVGDKITITLEIEAVLQKPEA